MARALAAAVDTRSAPRALSKSTPAVPSRRPVAVSFNVPYFASVCFKVASAAMSLLLSLAPRPFARFHRLLLAFETCELDLRCFSLPPVTVCSSSRERATSIRCSRSLLVCYGRISFRLLARSLFPIKSGAQLIDLACALSAVFSADRNASSRR